MFHCRICAGLAVILAALFATPALATPPAATG